MEILNQTNKYIEELGEKVSVQKNEVNKIYKGKKGPMKNDSEQSDADYEEEKVEEKTKKEDEEEEEYDPENMDDSEQIKYNLKNSSKTYYNITHSICDEVTDQPKMLQGG